MYLIGKKLKALRHSLGITQEVMAFDLGVAPSLISLIENDKRGITVSRLNMICKKYKREFKIFIK